MSQLSWRLRDHLLTARWARYQDPGGCLAVMVKLLQAGKLLIWHRSIVALVPRGRSKCNCSSQGICMHGMSVQQRVEGRWLQASIATNAAT